MSLIQQLPENPDNPYRLGRHQFHLGMLPAEMSVVKTLDWLKRRLDPIKMVSHQEFEPVFDQGNLGSCTANAALGCLVTAPFGHEGVSYTEDDAVKLYELETNFDSYEFSGKHYPPDDTGSTGPWSMMALQQLGKIDGFVHSTSAHTALKMLNRAPISIGVPWYKSMFTPDGSHVIHVDESSGVAGGHQVCVTANDVSNQLVRIRNSWGAGWGDQGHAWLSWSDLDFLLQHGGDVVQPVIEETQ